MKPKLKASDYITIKMGVHSITINGSSANKLTFKYGQGVSQELNEENITKFADEFGFIVDELRRYTDDTNEKVNKPEIFVEI